MTSKIIVDAHAGWPMRVTAVDQTNGEGPGSTETVIGTVAPGEKAEFHCTSTRKLLVEELGRETQTISNEEVGDVRSIIGDQE